MAHSDLNLLDSLKLHGDDVVLVDLDGGNCTRGQLGDLISQSIDQMRDYWGQRCGKLISLLPDHPSTLPFQIAAIASSSVIVANPNSSLPEIEQLVQETGSTAIVVQSASESLLELVEQLDLGLIELQPISASHFADFNLIFRRASSMKDNDDACRPSLVLTTSGSSGKPKVVPLHEAALLASANNIVNSLRLGKADTNIHMLPMFHIGAVLDLFIVPLISGGKICLAHPISSENLMRAIRETKPTWIQAVPTMLKALMRNYTKGDLKDIGETLRFVRSVSADLAPRVQEEVEQKMGVPVIQMYGMTETAGQICSNGLSAEDRKFGSVGKPAGCDVCILDQHGNDVPTGSVGEVCVTGENVFFGYANLGHDSAFHGKWFRTGDLGRFDEDGFLFLVGRTGDMVNRGGEKFSTIEVEQRLLELPGVAQASVFSIPHETLGEDVGAMVAPSGNAVLSGDTMREFLGTKLSFHKVPRHISIVDALPHLGSGKIDKKACRDRFLNKSGLITRQSAKSAVGKEIAKTWGDVLNQSEPCENDDFFDAGGDSLAAHTFILTLEERLGITLPVNILFEAPSFAELEARVSELIETGTSDQQEDQVYRAVRAATSAWSGHRANEKSLIIGLRNIGSKKPFFFCANGLQDYLKLSRDMDPDRPFYSMRSLSLLPEKTPENIIKLAQIYAEEVDRLQPSGPISLGGHCGGANVASAAADLLIERGREVDLLVIIDRVFKDVSQFPATIIWTEKSDYSHHSGASLFVNPEQGIHRLFPKGVRIHRIRDNHSGLMHSGSIREIVKIIERALERADVTEGQEGSVENAKQALTERQKVYKAALAVEGGRLCAPNSDAEFLVKITNLSDVEWGPTKESGIRLMAKWQRPNGKSYLSTGCKGELDRVVGPGQSTAITLKVNTRSNRTPLRLVVDLVDEGVSWFSWTGNKTASRWVLPWLP